MPRTYVYADYGGPENQRFIDLPKLIPATDQLLVAVRAAGVNPVDWKIRAGLRRKSESDHLEQPLGFGLEVAGIVETVGEGVKGFAPGDEVFGRAVGDSGSFGEYALLSEDAVVHKPPTVSFVDAATLSIAASTAYDGINQLDLKPDEVLLITGVGGGVGIAAAQIALARDLRVIGTASEAKRDFVEAVGATFVVYGPGTLDRIRAVAPDGVAAIFDLVGGNALREVAPLATDPTKIISAGDAKLATELGGGPVARKRNSEVLEALAELVANGALKPFVTNVFPLDKAGDALALVESGHAIGKVVIEVS